MSNVEQRELSIVQLDSIKMAFEVLIFVIHGTKFSFIYVMFHGTKLHVMNGIKFQYYCMNESYTQHNNTTAQQFDISQRTDKQLSTKIKVQQKLNKKPQPINVLASKTDTKIYI